MNDPKKDKIVELLEDILKWTRFQGWRNVKQVLVDALGDQISRKVYQLSDGKRTSRQIAKNLPISQRTVTEYWKKWTKVGIMEPMKVKGGGTRGVRIFSLDDFGIEY